MQSLCKMFVKWPVYALRLPANARKMMLDTAKGVPPMIYYVEDDDNIRELVIYTLTQMNLPCKGFWRWYATWCVCFVKGDYGLVAG